MTGRALTVGATSYPVVLPNIRDPRLHVASVILTVHLLGQLGLHFAVSIPQILAAILTCAVIEVALTFRHTRSFVWPASAMLIGSGVALVLRIGTPPGDHWSTQGWYVFAGVAGLALLTKYVIKYRGTHIFNPSNLGLVGAFVILGASRVQPLDLWWGPMDIWLLIAYVVILGGGLLIDRRLHLLPIVAAFYLTFALTIGTLSASGHCITTEWSFAPVCGVDYWRILMTSPEVMIFLLFMITDPKTVPGGRVARVAFGMLVAIMCTLLMAPQTNEFGTKVGLLAGLVVMCATRPLMDRMFPAPRSAGDTLAAWGTRLLSGGRAAAGLSAARVVAFTGLAVVLVLTLTVGIVFAGSPSRGVVAADVTEVLNRVPHQVDAASLPQITVDQAVGDFDLSLVGPGAQQLVLTLGENLLLENEALKRKDGAILTAVDHGDRLDEMQKKLADAIATGTTTTETYHIDTVKMSLLQPFGKQSGLSIGMDSTGTVTEETYDPSGRLVSSTTSPFAKMFVIRRATGGRCLNVAVLPPGSKG